MNGSIRETFLIKWTVSRSIREGFLTKWPVTEGIREVFLIKWTVGGSWASNNVASGYIR